MKKFLSFVLFLSLMSATFTGCKHKNKGVPPVLSSVETMLIDFSDFTITSGFTGNSFNVKGIVSNWEYAAGIVSDWRTLTAVTLSTPIALYEVAFDRQPSHVSGNKWEWSYNVNVSAMQYKVRLTGEISGSQVKWEMYVSRDGSGGVYEFKWLEGTSNTDGNNGSWTFYESYDSQTALLQIDWTKLGTKVEKIKYVYLKSGYSKDAYIEYGSATGGYDFYYEVHYYNTLLGRPSDARIEWNKSSKAGRIRSADYLLDEWQCWDSQRIDVVCN